MNGLAALVGAIVIGSEPPALTGTVLDYDEAIQVASTHQKPMVTFYGVEARPVPGLVAASVPEGRQLIGVPFPALVVCAFGPGVRASYNCGPGATDEELRAKAAEMAASVTGTRVIRGTPATLPPDVLRRLPPNCTPRG